MRRASIHVIACLGGALLAGVSTARATVLVPATLSELSRDAQVIVRGRVIDVRAQWADDPRRVETIVVFEADGYLKGDYGRQLVFKVPGGDIGRYRSVMVGAPVFRPGDEVVVFLGTQGPAVPHLIGFGQGVVRLVRDAATGRTLVTSPPLDASGRWAQPVRRGDPARQPIPYEQFAARVQSIVAPVGRATQRAQAADAPTPGTRRGVVVPDRRKGSVKQP